MSKKEVLKQYVSFNDLAKEYKKDQTYISTLVRKYGLTVTLATHNKHPCKALSLKEKERLEKKNPNLIVPKVRAGEIEINALAKERKQDVSGLLKMLKENNFKIEKRLREDGGRPVNVLSEKEYARLTKKFPPRVKV
jgi:hypothetical protein